jgi:hypothetical protein
MPTYKILKKQEVNKILHRGMVKYVTKDCASLPHWKRKTREIKIYFSLSVVIAQHVYVSQFTGYNHIELAMNKYDGEIIVTYTITP